MRWYRYWLTVNFNKKTIYKFIYVYLRCKDNPLKEQNGMYNFSNMEWKINEYSSLRKKNHVSTNLTKGEKGKIKQNKIKQIKTKCKQITTKEAKKNEI